MVLEPKFIRPWYRGGYLGLSWGFPGGYLGVRRGAPHQTPSKPPGNSMLIPFLQRTGITEYMPKKILERSVILAYKFIFSTFVLNFFNNKLYLKFKDG